MSLIFDFLFVSRLIFLFFTISNYLAIKELLDFCVGFCNINNVVNNKTYEKSKTNESIN